MGFAVLGCGRIGRMHARVLARHPKARLVSVYDVVAQSAAETARELGLGHATDIAAVWADPAVDAVLIASPTDTHVPLIVRAVQAGKAVLCEKPIDLDTDRAAACWAEIETFDPIVMIGFNRRFDPSFRSLRDRVVAGEIGRLEQVVITSRDPAPPPVAYIRGSGGLFRDMTIHDFDMARYLAGDIVEVQAFGANLIDPEIGGAGDIDAAMITLRAASGALIHIGNSRRASYGYDQRLEAFGSEGMLQAGNRRATTVQSWGAHATAAQDPVLDFFIARYREAYEAEIDHFIESATQRTPMRASFADGLAALRLADAAEQSMRTGRSVRLDG